MRKHIPFIVFCFFSAVLVGSWISSRIDAAIPIIFLRAGTNAVVEPPDETNEVGEFYTNMFIEAEDYGYTDVVLSGGGRFMPSQPGTNFNATETHADLSDTEGIEFECWDIASDNDYRVANGLHVNLHDDNHEPNGVPFNDYKIRNFTAVGPDWFDYARRFTNDFYRVYARLSSTTNIHIELAEIDDQDWLVPRGSQSLTPIGSINTNGTTTNTFFYAPFKTNGVAVEVNLGAIGTNGLSVMITNGLCDFHRLMLVRWTGTPMGFANPETDPDVIFVDENGVPFHDPEIL